MAKNPEQRDLFAGALEIMILQSLRLKPMHGYALVKHIKEVSENLLQVEEGSLYPALQRLLSPYHGKDQGIANDEFAKVQSTPSLRSGLNIVGTLKWGMPVSPHGRPPRTNAGCRASARGRLLADEGPLGKTSLLGAKPVMQ